MNPETTVHKDEASKMYTADPDLHDTFFMVEQGGNGDWYIVMQGTSRDEIHRMSVRVCMSGGWQTPEVSKAIRDLYCALRVNGGYKEGWNEERAKAIVEKYKDR